MTKGLLRSVVIAAMLNAYGFVDRCNAASFCGSAVGKFVGQGLFFQG
jgi:hypothetical protein